MRCATLVIYCKNEHFCAEDIINVATGGQNSRIAFHEQVTRNPHA